MGQPQTKKLVIPSKLDQACFAQQAILSDVAACNYSEEAKFAIRLALDEALSNAVRHGNRGDASKHVHIEYHVTPKLVKVMIRDEGPGFAPRRVPDPTLDENIERPNGRGIMLMKAYMTEVHFNREGNTVTLIKRRDCPLPHSH